MEYFLQGTEEEYDVDNKTSLTYNKNNVESSLSQRYKMFQKNLEESLLNTYNYSNTNNNVNNVNQITEMNINTSQNNLITNTNEEYYLKDNVSESVSTNEFMESNISINIEQPIDELRSYINMIGLSIPDSDNMKTNNDIMFNNQSFRPSNLPKKSKQEEELHKKLVEENRKLYLSYLKEKQTNEREQEDSFKKSKYKDSKQATVWEKEIIPYWFKKKRDNELKKYFYDGVPSSLRGKIWLMCIGNNFSITPDYYEIEVKKAI